MPGGTSCSSEMRQTSRMGRQRNPHGCGRIAASTGEPCRRPGCDGTHHPAVFDVSDQQDARAVLAEHSEMTIPRRLDPMTPIHNARIGFAAAQKRGASPETVKRWEDAVAEREQMARELGIEVTGTPDHMYEEVLGAQAPKDPEREQRSLGYEPTEETSLALSYVADPQCQLGTCETCGGGAMLDTGTSDIDRGTAKCLLNFCSSSEWILGCLDGCEVFDIDLEETIWREAASIERAVRSKWPDVDIPTTSCVRCISGELDDGTLAAGLNPLCTSCHHEVCRRLDALTAASR